MKSHRIDEQQQCPSGSGDFYSLEQPKDDRDKSGMHGHHQSHSSPPGSSYENPLHHHQHNRHSTQGSSMNYPSEIPMHLVSGPGMNMTNSSTITSNQMQGKLSRPRRRGKRPTRSDCSITSDSSENSLLSRYPTTTASNNRLLRRGGGGSSGYFGLVQNQYPSSSSLFGVGSTYSAAGSVSSTNTATTPLHSSSSVYDSLYKHDTSSTATSLDYRSQSQHSFPPPPPPLPLLKAIASELVLICSLYCRYAIHSVRKPCQRCKQTICYTLLTIATVAFLLTVWLFFWLFADAIQVCTPPPSHYHNSPSPYFAQQHAYFDTNAGMVGGLPLFLRDGEEEPIRPLVEYYVHGRGIGHYARSVAIVEQLNRAGVDVRMFLTRSAMWRAMHEDSKIVDGDDDQTSAEADATANAILAAVNDAGVSADKHPQRQHSSRRGKTTAISVASLTPQQNPFEVLSHVVERVMGDCEVAASSGRYPDLIISDGDMPGMMRAELGGIPSVGIAHGQLFSIAQKPAWVKSVPHLNRAWNKQGRLNYITSLFTEWQIATHFCFLESQYASGTVARAPLRPEVLHMAESRKLAREGTVHVRALPQGERIRKLLLPEGSEQHIEGLEHAHNSTKTERKLHSSPTRSSTLRRKLVICYFRDHNGEIVVQALLDAGFDVLLFDNGYYKDMANDPNRYGAKWIVQDHKQERRSYIRGEDRRRLQNQDMKQVNVDHSNMIESNMTHSHRHHGRRSSETVQEHENIPHGPRLIRVMDRSLFVPLMHVADGVASSAGSQLMSECIFSHMPLLALYVEDDDEQRLNVELSHHTDGPCHRPMVFGTSFESLTSGLESNETYFAAHHSVSPILDSLTTFIQEVRASPISDTFFRNVDWAAVNPAADQANSTNKEERQPQFAASERTKSTASSHKGYILEEDPFQPLPDAAAIILEIVKQVLQKRY